MIDEFQKIEDELNASYESNDAGRIAKLLSSDWIILESSTGISDKNQFVKAIEDGKLSHTSMKKEVSEVKVHGDMAIVITRGRNVGRYQEVEFDSEQWVTNIYRLADSRWVCIMTQETVVGC